MNKDLPKMTMLFAASSLLWFGYVSLKYGTTENNTVLYNNGAMLGTYFTPTEWWRLISPIFAHIGLHHLISNMILLLTLGPIIESIIGHTKFAIIYLFSGIGGNFAVLMLNPDTITAGASTALYGLFGLLLIQIFNKRNNLLRNIGNVYIGIIIVNLFYTFTSTNVSVVGHLGGLATGIVFGLIELAKS